ncbi:agmatinase, partial [Limnospira sp. PMC 1042.18]
MQSTITAKSVVDFLGSEIVPNQKTDKVAILPIPFEATTTYRKGCENGPGAILEASQQLECYDDELEAEIGLIVGIYTHEAIADTRESQSVSLEEMLRVTTETVKSLADQGKFVIALGGEHGITAGVVEAYRQSSTEPFTVVQIDAHGDLRHEYEGSIYNHACVMRRVVEMGLPTVQIGIRSICKAEADLIRDQEMKVIWGREIARGSDWIQKAIASIPTKRVFLTIDLDGIDPSIIPGVGTPEPGGLSWYDLIAFLRQLFISQEVIGCDVMELAPVVDSVVSEFTAAKLVYKLVGYQALAKGWIQSAPPAEARGLRAPRFQVA